MDTLIDLLILALSTYRLAQMLSNPSEGGPWGILHKFRAFIGVTWGESPRPITAPGSLAEMVMCSHCNSIWIGLIISAFYGIIIVSGAQWLVYGLLPLALSGFVVILDR